MMVSAAITVSVAVVVATAAATMELVAGAGAAMKETVATVIIAMKVVMKFDFLLSHSITI